MQRFSKTENIIGIVLLLTLVFGAGVYVGDRNIPAINKVFNLSNKESEIAKTADFSSFWKVWKAIDEKYPRADEVTNQARVYGAISGLMSSLNDPYSVFFAPEEAKSFEEEIAGNFTGVGMEVGLKEGILTVVAPLKNTPAYRANIKPGDRILKIDKKSTAGFSIEEAIKLMRGEKGTTVVLTILHEGDKESIEISIVRDVINIPTLDTELRKDGIFVIKLYSFSASSASLFRNAIKEFASAGTDKLLLDLRGNPGGYLTASVDISSWFLPGGETVVTEDYGSDTKPEVFRSKGYDVFSDKLKFVILIDGGSASASEIVAGAMQDHKRAKLVGTKSYGKGSVQETMKITPDTLLKITVAKWLTPNGNLIAEKGLIPDYEVKFTKKDAQEKNDPQLMKAVELLLNWK
jgi:carboxyl-terminal processing protease